MSDSLVLQQAKADAILYQSFSEDQKSNLLREIRYLLYCQKMYNFSGTIDSKQANLLILESSDAENQNL